MDIEIINVSGWTYIRTKGKEICIRQKQKDFLNEEFNITLQSKYHKGTYKKGGVVSHEITHDNTTLSPKQEQKHTRYNLKTKQYE